MSKESKTIDVVCAIILKDKKVLLTRRSKKMRQPLMWEFPGGKVKNGEKPEETIKREIKEEVNLEISIIDQLSSQEHTYPDESIRLIPYIATYKTGKVILSEHQEYAWESIQRLSNYHLAPADRPILEKLIIWWKNQDL